MNLEIGDVLLYPSRKVGKDIRKKVKFSWLGPLVEFGFRLAMQFARQKVIHAGLHIGGYVSIEATSEGVKLVQLKEEEASDLVVVRRRKPLTKKEKESIVKTAKRYVNVPYDFESLFVNALLEASGPLLDLIVAKKGGIYAQVYDTLKNKGIDPETLIESFIPFEDEKEVICSELVIRIYQESKISPNPFEGINPEFTSPQDILDLAKVHKDLVIANIPSWMKVI